MQKTDRWIKKIFVVTFAFGLVGFFAWRISLFRLTKNFYEVDPGKFYRSAQLSGPEFTEVIKKYGIKTVVNLRGMSNPWYKEGEEAIEGSGAKIYNIHFETEYVPEKKSLVEYLDVLKTAERPILIHCRSGADRTGEETAIYAIEYMGMEKEKATDEYLHYRFWHFPLFQPSKTFFMEHYKGEQWVREEYNPCKQPFLKYKKFPHTCKTADQTIN